MNDQWYWVTPLDVADALGDYGGLTLQAPNEAREFILAEYKEWFRLQATDDADASPSLLTIKTVRTVHQLDNAHNAD